MSRSGI
jgi:acetoin utilization deacetylase AcuC-like enzyme